MTTKALQTELSFIFGRSMTTKALQTELSFIFGEVNDNKGTLDRIVIYIWGSQ